MFSFGSVLRISSVINSCKTVLNPTKQTFNFYNQTAGVKTLEERLGLPAKPKKPLTPYFLFLRDLRPRVAAANPNKKCTDIVKILANEWEKADESLKTKLLEEYKKEKISYIQKKAKYDTQVTKEQKNDLKVLRRQIVDAREKRAAKKKIKELGRPKKPLTSFLKFLKREREVSPLGNTETYRQWQRRASDKWNNLTESEKEVLNMEARKDLEKFRIELSKWEEKMVRLGHIDVVRHEALIGSSQPISQLKGRRTFAKSDSQ